MKKINFGAVALRVLYLIIVKPFVLPFNIYKNTLQNLANNDNEDSAESTLSQDFPIYVWFIDYYDAIIALIYPIGALVAIYAGIEGDFGEFFGTVVGCYFAPLVLGLIKEILSITLKTLQYLKIISNK